MNNPMALQLPQAWDSRECFEPLKRAIAHLNSHARRDYLQWLQKTLDQLHGPLRNHHGKTIRFVAQGAKAATLQQQYEPRIYLNGEVQTRENRHDFFHALVWMSFPDSKRCLNRIHYQAILKRHENRADMRDKRRGAAENALTLFDECGVVVAGSDPGMLEDIRQHRWQQLFHDKRQEFRRKLRCIVFGHALYEKCLHPYIGLCGKALLLSCDETMLGVNIGDNIGIWDRWLHQQLQSLDFEQGPRILSPLPLLGIPGWHSRQTRRFYANDDYFRPLNT